MDFTELTIKSASELLATKKISAVELAEMSLKRIKEVDDKLHAFLYVAEKESLESAKKGDQLIADGENFSLTGIPYAAKDNILVKGMQATAASKILGNYKATYDATVIKKLNEEQPVLMGKTNLDEFAMGASTENSAFGPTKNPHDLSRVPGGSSGGSAAAVASGEVLFALGTDTGGSVRQPAAFCGIVGFKPTYGRASRYGLISLGSSLDQPGVLAKNVEDAATVFQLMAGQDVKDSTSLPKPVPDYLASLSKANLKGLKVGLPKEYFIDGLDPEIAAALKNAANKLSDLGANVSEVSLPHSEYALASYYVILPVEISANLSRYDGIRYGLSVPGKTLEEVYYNSRSQGFGVEPKRRIMIGTYASSAGYYDAYYKKAKQAQSLIRKDFTDAFEKFDLLLTPTTPTPAFKFGEKSDPVSMYLADIFTVGLNIAGVPGLSMPVGLTKSGLPIGAQLVATHFAEDKLFMFGHALEQALNLKLKPNL